MAYIRHWVWLNTAPVPERKQALGKLADIKPLTRLEQKRKDRKDDEYEPETADIEGLDHVIAHFWDCGPAIGGTMGSSSLTHQEIEAWQRNTGIELDAWESRMLRRLSVEYLDWNAKARSVTCPSPLAPPIPTEEERIQIGNSIRDIFRSMMRGSKP